MNSAHLNAVELLTALGVAAAYATLGVIVFLVAFKIMAKLIPFSVRKEIEEDQNIALGILMGSVILGLAIIIGSAVG